MSLASTAKGLGYLRMLRSFKTPTGLNPTSLKGNESAPANATLLEKINDKTAASRVPPFPPVVPTFMTKLQSDLGCKPSAALASCLVESANDFGKDGPRTAEKWSFVSAMLDPFDLMSLLISYIFSLWRAISSYPFLEKKARIASMRNWTRIH